MEIRILKNPYTIYIQYVVITIFSIYALFSLSDYIVWDSAFILAISSIPLMLKSNQNATTNRLILPILILLLVNFLIHTNILRYLSFALSILLLIESQFGKIKYSILAIVLITSPFMKFMHSLYSYELREKIGQIVESVLIKIDPNTKIYGNIIFFEGQKFSIDPGCAGIQMVFISFVIGTVFLIYLEIEKSVQFNCFEIISNLILIFLFNLINNLIRITFLIIFIILPENALHDIVGILSLIIFTLAPAGIMAYYYTIKFKKRIPITDKLSLKKTNHTWSYFMAVLVIIISSKPAQANTFSNEKPLKLNGYKSLDLKEGIIQYSNNHSIIYQKPTFIFKSEHNPMVCWQGSGYDLQNIKTQNIHNQTVKTGTLISGNDTLYTAWWFDNGSKTMIDQWQWRKDQFLNHSKPYFLINMSTENREELNLLIKNYQKNKSMIW